MRPQVTKAFGLFVVSLLLSQTALGGRLEFEPAAAVTLRYSDNPTLIPDESDPEAAASAVTELSARIAQQSPDTSLVVNPKFRRIEYFDSKFDEASGNEYLLDGQISKSRGQASLGSGFRFTNLTVLTAEAADPNDPNPGVSGNFLRVDDRVENLTASPFIYLNLSEIDFLSFTGQISRVDQIKRLSPRADYTSWSGSIAYQRSLAERHFVGFAANGSRTDSVKRFEYCTFFSVPTVRDTCLGLTGINGDPSEKFIVTQTNEQDFDTYSGSVTYEYRASENLNLKANLGLQKTDINQTISEFRNLEKMKLSLTNQSSFDSRTYLLAATYSQPRTDWELQLTRDVQPSSEGNPADKEQVSGKVTHRVTQRWTVIASALYYRQTQRSATTSSKNNWLYAEFDLTRRMSKNFSIGARYLYQNSDPQFDSIDPITSNNFNLNRISHTVTVTIRYRFR